MSYTPPGYFEVPDGDLLPSLCSRIKGEGTNTNWESQLGKVIDKLGRQGRRAKSIGLEDVVGAEGEGLFAPGTPGLRAFQHVMLRFLRSIGSEVENYPAVIGYKRTPKLSLDECLTRMIDVTFPTLDSLGGEQAFTVEALKTTFPTIVREIAARDRLRQTYADRLRLKLGDIAFKLATGKAIDQAERSFFVSFSNTDLKTARTKQERETGVVKPVNIGEAGDPLVHAAWDRFRAVTEAGPYLRFYTMVSNRSFESLTYWVGPLQQQLVFPIGYSMSYGPFDELRTSAAFTLPWTREDQLIASRERNFTHTLVGGSLDRNVPIAGTVEEGFEPQPMWDLPNVDIRVDLDSSKIMPTEYSYYSTWRARRVSDRFHFSPADMLQDLALSTDTAGEGRSSGRTLDSWPLLDLQMSKEHLGEKNVPFRLESEAWLDQFFFPHPAEAGVIGTKKVDMRPFYQRQGTTVLPPAFREYVMAPLSWLHIPDPEAEKFVVARLGMTYERALQAERVIRICVNYGKLRRLLPKATQLPVDLTKLKLLVKVLAGLTSSAVIKEA